MKLNENQTEQLLNRKQQIIEKLRTIKNISLDQAAYLYDVLETYCELIINYTLRNPDE
jgi:hypothetical protein